MTMTMTSENTALPIKSQWFMRRRIDDDITLLWEPYVHSFLRCNIWHIRGRDRDLLVDTGMGISSLRQAAQDLFGHSLTAVMTHTHMDHSGGAHEFEHCVVHELEAKNLSDALDSIPLETRFWPADLVEEMNKYDPVDEYVISARPDVGFDPTNCRLQPAAPVQLLKNGDMLDLGNRVFEVMHLPGHSPGSIGLWEQATGTLFSGDAVYDGVLLDELPGSDKQDYQKTMERLMDLPINIVHGGHEPSFGRERLREIAGAYLEGRKLDYSEYIGKTRQH
ncbi:MAG: MBL fold metallo-hydrolase [Pseudomonadota bacterium]